MKNAKERFIVMPPCCTKSKRRAKATCPGDIEPVSLKRFNILETAPCDTRKRRLMSHGLKLLFVMNIIKLITWFLWKRARLSRVGCYAAEDDHLWRSHRADSLAPKASCCDDITDGREDTWPIILVNEMVGLSPLERIFDYFNKTLL